MDEQPKPPFHPDSIRRDVGFVALALQAFAATAEVFLRRHGTFGERYLGARSLLGAALIFLFPVFWPDHDPAPMLGFLCVYLSACASARVGVLRRVRRGGPQPHSLYSGTPWLMRFTGRLNEVTVKGIVEPILVFLIGAFMLPVSEPLGMFLIIASAGVMGSVQLAIGEERQRAIEMNDAYIDQREAADRLREMQDR